MHKILVVDNEPEELKLLRKAACAGPDRTVFEATSAYAAVDLIKRENFDVIVTDLNMDGATAGFHVLESAIQKDPLTQVILVTAFGSMSISEKTMEMGAFDYLDRTAPELDVQFMIRKKVEMAIRYRSALVSGSSRGTAFRSEGASPLFLNVWFPEYQTTHPCLLVGKPTALSVNIGPIRTMCLIPEEDPQQRFESLHLFYSLPHVDVLLNCFGASVDASRKRLVLPPGPEACVEFQITPLGEPTVRIAVSILISNEPVHRSVYGVECTVLCPAAKDMR